MTLRILTLLILLTAFAIAQPPQASAPSSPSPSPKPTTTPPPAPGYVSNIVVIKDAANIAFFLITSVLAILTYLQARRTIFTPFRTEAFKLQLKAFEDVLVFFEKHPTMSIDDEFDFNAIVHFNTLKLMDAYAFQFFHDEIDIEAVKKARGPASEQIVGARVSKNFMQKHFELPTHSKEDTPPADHPTNPAIILARWQEYEHGMIEFTKRFQEASDRLRRFKVSPLLPRELKNRIEAFEKVVSENLSAVGTVMTEVAQKLPDKYPTTDSLKKADLSWIWNLYNRKRVQLAESRNSILSFLTDYLQIDTLLPRKAESGRENGGRENGVRQQIIDN